MILADESTSEGPNCDYHNLNTVGPRKLTAHQCVVFTGPLRLNIYTDEARKLASETHHDCAVVLSFISNLRSEELGLS
ncbi:hypothetical protein NEOLEDRAFT_1141896 [Neolentinus lepideus HHB14362 ss-1]|uniref:Uncharacterized protein n=1 Tax=Neolentinus lepideus HHB14362 ss-1 TaxID=1314782 RepID=A0A165NF34_9AGAM|nr:hypothetical protein NEOLEDRAFT_1141896 [Neolentinus lepideus HHB14362 ss-1]